MPSRSRSRIRRSRIVSQCRLRAKLSSVMKNLWMPWAQFWRTSCSTSSAVRNLRLATLDVDDRAERALIGTAAARIEAGADADRAHDIGFRQEGRGRPLQPGQIVHEVVERRELPIRRVAQHLLEPSLAFARESGNAELPALGEVDGVVLEHRQAAGDMKPADHHLHARSAKPLSDIEGARILIGLHADQRDQAEIAVAAQAADQRVEIDAGVGLVDRLDIDLDIRARAPAGPRSPARCRRGPRANSTESSTATSG